MTHLGLLAVAHLALIWSTMSQPKIFGLVSLFCMKSWFFIFIMKTLHIVFMNLTWIIQISVEGGLPRQSEKWFGRFRTYEPSRPSRLPELRWVMESFGNRITHRNFHSRERRLEQQVWLSQHLALALHHKRVLGSRRRYFQDFSKTKKIDSKSDFRFRSGSGRFSNMPYHIREPYWGLHESGNDLRKKKHNQGNSKSIIFYLIQEYRPNMLIECPTKTLQCLTSLFMIIPCDVNSSQNARVFCDALFKNEWNGCCVFLEFSRLFISSI